MRGEVYLVEAHVELLRGEDESVKKRYRAVARTLSGAFGVTRARAAEMIGRSKRQLQRIVRRFKEEGVPGLRFKSRRPKHMPNKTPSYIEERVVELRKATGFGPMQVAGIVNEGLRVEGNTITMNKTTSYNILVRNGLIESERRITKEYKTFEWGYPDELIQADITRFNGTPILTMEDDHSRKGWATRLINEEDDTIIEGMRKLHSWKYCNLLTDNGSQFSRKNTTMRRYCEQQLLDRHIWTSIHHPQTMGKLSNLQKGLKAFLRHRVGRIKDPAKIDEAITTYLDWYNNGKTNSTTEMYPEERYSGKRDQSWYAKLVKALKLESILPIPQEGVTHLP
jgi:hypothetical protein